VVAPKKSLGQHWLRDRPTLEHIADCAALQPEDTVLEIGPGLGTLTSELLRRSGRVVAVEFDSDLAGKLPAQFPGKNLKVIQSDILSFDLSSLPKGYKVVANVPYYITSKIVQLLLTAVNKPSIIVLLVQKEVAERLAAQPGDMSILAVSAQVFAEVSLGEVVPAGLFTPPPQVDSQVVILKTRPQSKLDGISEKAFFSVVRAGFSAKRKKLRSSISAALHMEKPEAEHLLRSVAIDPDARAETISIEQWRALAEAYTRS
jgi:16S rRNA (adenine1518-N6/adenine1519-N6)-dimethyltransferase